MSAPGAVAITHAVLVDGTGGTPQEDVTVVVRDGRVDSIGPSARARPPLDASVIDATGLTVMPALADMHVHLVGGYDGLSTDVLGYRRYLDALLYCGVTSVLDTGNLPPLILQLRQETEAGRLRGPRVFCVGPVVDGPDPVWPSISVAIASVHQVPGLVKELARLGAQFIKAYVGLSEPVVRALVEEGRGPGLRVLMDGGRRNGSVELIRSGIAAFAHAGPEAFSADAVSAMREEGMTCITTLAVFEAFSHRRLQDKALFAERLWRETVPGWVTEQLEQDAGRVPSSSEHGKRQKAAERFDASMRNVRRLHEAGVPLVAGTDAPYPGVPLGEGLHHELELLVEAGLTPLEAISCATRNAAELVKADDWGTVAPGKRADLLIVDGRPDKCIADTRNIRAVIQGGRSIDRAALGASLLEDGGLRPYPAAAN